MAGTFNWNYAYLLREDEEHQWWYDPVNDTVHKIQKAK